MSHSQLAIGEFGAQVLADLFVVSWLGMTPNQIDCHVYVLRGPTGLLLIDCGTAWSHHRIIDNMKHWGLRIEDVRSILATHGHIEHVGGGHLFKRRGVEVLSHRELMTMIECQWEATGYVESEGVSHRVDGYMEDGDRLSRCGFDILVKASPGHSSQCLSFLIAVNQAPCLFSGDLVMGDGYPGFAGDPGFNLEKTVASMKSLLPQPFVHLCFGHGVMMNDRGELFRKAIDLERQGEWTRPGGRCVPATSPREKAAASRF